MKTPEVRKSDRHAPTLETVLKRKAVLLAEMPKDYGEAAMLIETGYAAITGRQVTMSENEDIAAQYFRAWERAMGERKYPLSPVIEVLVDGEDPYDVDQRHWRKSHWCAELVLAALSLYAETRRGLTPVLIYK